MIDTIIKLGDYTITAEVSNYALKEDKNYNVYCVTNTVTGVREFESTMIDKALGALKHFSDVWDARSTTLSSLSLVGKDTHH